MYQGSIKKTSNFLNLTEECVSEVYLKYSSQINQALKKELNEDKMNQAINESIDIMEGHMKEIKKAQKQSQTKYLRDRTLQSCLQTVDRLAKVKEATNDAYYKCLAGLNDSILKTKLAEKAEEGIDFDNGIYAKNQKTVADLIAGTKDGNKKTGLNSSKSCQAIDLLNNTTHSYSSIQEFLSEAGMSFNDLYYALGKKKDADGSVTIGNWKYLGPSSDIRIINEGSTGADKSMKMKIPNSEAH